MNGLTRILYLLCVCLCSGAWLTSCNDQQPSAITHLPYQAVQGGKWGIMRTDGKACAAEVFVYRPSAVVNGFFTVADSTGRLCLYRVDEEGIPTQIGTNRFSQLGYFFGGQTIGQPEPDAPLCIVGKDGQVIAELKDLNGHAVTMAHNFSDGRALVCTDQGKYGYVDGQGHTIVQPLFDFACDFSNGIALVGKTGLGGERMYSVIGTDGTEVFPWTTGQCRIAGPPVNGLLSYQRNGRWALMDKTGKTTVTFPESVTGILPSGENAVLTLNQNGVGLADGQGRTLIPGIYERGKIIGQGRVAFRLHGKWAVFDFSGKALTEFQFDGLTPYFDGRHAVAFRPEGFQLIGTDGQPVSTHVYAGIVTDPIAEGVVPQVFYRHAPSVQSDSATLGPEAPELATEPASRPQEPALDVNAAQEISRNNPFFQEAQKIFSGNLEEPDAHRRGIILDYVERFRKAYTTKDLAFIEQVFSEDALIVVGKVVRASRPVEGQYLSAPQVQYNIKNKKEYITRLKEVFDSNKKIRLRFADFKIMRHPTKEKFYGVTMRQGYASDLYSDDGYLFLLWDFTDEQAPKIHVRTWQPSMLDAKTPLPLEKVFGIRDFNFE